MTDTDTTDADIVEPRQSIMMNVLEHTLKRNSHID